MKHLSLYLILTLWLVWVVPSSGICGPDMEKMGMDAVAAAKKALSPGQIDVCLTNAGSALLDNQSCGILLDVFSGESGVSLGQGSLLTVHRAWGEPPWAAFVSQPSPKELNMVLVRITAQGPDLKGPLNVWVDKETDFTPFYEILGKEAFSLVTLANGWADKVPPQVLFGSLFHDHLCCGVFTGYFTSRYILEQFPLTEGQGYIYIGTPAWCQDDLIMNMLNLTPGKHGYVTMAYPWSRPWKTADAVYNNLGGIVVRKDGPAGGGTAWVLSFDWQWDKFQKFAGLSQDKPDWKNDPWLHVMYNRFFTRHLDRPSEFVSVIKSRKLETKEEVDTLVRLGANPLEILLGKDSSWPESH
ncbi:FmdE family protein [Desulfotignum phosphitoxidans]|uniref:Formylmethanofuran dehydrogenase subunit E domain-containing protein n=1 Tax=Desulfotignum phosphitoxidans DSM 13687 TaxID=1286635 RepID=S0G1X3_9BACT|nr:FmdE family protein [Desulfotignum phosphitoxidans]EMS81338.1 hypothetical protein Dpo_1c04790 [Desulfotignum phosphitoxidans DSM 13687]